MRRKLIYKREIYIIAALLLATFTVRFILPEKAGNMCEIIVGGRTVETVSLSEDRIIRLDGGIVLEVKDNRIGFTESSCPDKICVRMGFIGTSGQTAACLPNKTAIKIISDGGGAFDAVAY